MTMPENSQNVTTKSTSETSPKQPPKIPWTRWALIAVIVFVGIVGIIELCRGKASDEPAAENRMASEASTSSSVRAVATIPAGTYVVTQMSDEGQDYDLATVIALMQMGGATEKRITLTIDGNGNAVFSLFGEKETMTYDEENFYSAASGMQSQYSWDGQQLMTTQDTTVVVFVPEADYVEPELDEQTRQTLESLVTEGITEE